MAEDGARAPKSFPTVLKAEATSKSLCEENPHRVHVSTRWGTECIAYHVTKGQEDQREAVIFLDGDIAIERFADPGRMRRDLKSIHRVLQRWADKLKVRYIYISRLGTHGSSGNHGERRKPTETMIMNAVVDVIKKRLGLERIVLAGQSGGSTIAASLLSLGRRDVACAVLGSGAFEMVELRHADLTRSGFRVTKEELDKVTFDPSSHVDAIPPDARRRIFILGGEADARTPFDQQARYAESLEKHGHHVKVMTVDAQGKHEHGATLFTIPTAGGCLKGAADDALVAANATLGRSLAAGKMGEAATASGSLALMSAALRWAEKNATFGE